MNELINNRYLIVKKIGSGGMAEVYLALDTVLDREVALKILRGDLSHDPVALLRFQREANAISKLNNPSVVEVYDVGEDNGQHYIVMEYITGTTLKTLLKRRGALDRYEAVSIMRQLTEALFVAHEANIIHRDIKPQNVLIKDDGTVKLTDFGIAIAGDALELTRHDSVLGSVHYMAPELSRGEGASVQSDIYALGVVFYELLSGELPYRGETPVEIAMKHMRDPFPSILALNPSLPNAMENIIMKATHKNRTARYLSVQDFLKDLNKCLDKEAQNEPLWVFQEEETEPDGTKVVDKLDGVDSTKKSKRTKIFIGIAAVVISVTLAVVLAMYLPTKSQSIELPVLQGLTVEQAKEKLEELGLNIDKTYNYDYSDDYENGIVMGSKPGEGATVRKGDLIKLTVSHGKTFIIEDYTGKTVSEVEALLKNQPVTIKVVKQPTKEKSPGIVLSQEGLKPGDKVIPNQRRELILNVSAEVQVVIPDSIIGKPLTEAQDILRELGILYRTEKLPPNGAKDIEYSVIIKSDPSPGSYYVQTNDQIVTLYYYDLNDKEPETVIKPETGKPKPEDGAKPDREDEAKPERETEAEGEAGTANANRT